MDAKCVWIIYFLKKKIAIQAIYFNFNSCLACKKQCFETHFLKPLNGSK